MPLDNRRRSADVIADWSKSEILLDDHGSRFEVAPVPNPPAWAEFELCRLRYTSPAERKTEGSIWLRSRIDALIDSGDFIREVKSSRKAKTDA